MRTLERSKGGKTVTGARGSFSREAVGVKSIFSFFKFFLDTTPDVRPVPRDRYQINSVLFILMHSSTAADRFFALRDFAPNED